MDVGVVFLERFNQALVERLLHVVDGKEDGAADAVDATYGENDQPLVFMVHFQRWIKGMMDEVAIFNRALSEDEINQIMSGGLSQSVLAVEPAGKLGIAWGALKIAR